MSVPGPCACALLLALATLAGGCATTAPAGDGASAAPLSPDPPAWPDPLPPAAPGVPTLHKGLAVGTWAPDAPGDFAQAWLDEAGLRTVAGSERVARRVWRGFATPADVVPFDALLGEREGEAVAYAFSLVQRTSPDLPPAQEAAAALHVRHRGRLRAWFDGRLVLDEPPAADGGWREARAPVLLTGPYDVLLLKCGRGSPAFGPSLDVQVRLSAPDGTPLPGATWNSMRPPGLPSDL